MMKDFRFLIVLLIVTFVSLKLFSQEDEIRSKQNNRAPIAYNVNTTIGGDNVLSSLKLEIIGDNLQVYRNIGSNNWSYQYYNWSDHPGRGIHLYIGGNFYYVNSSTDIFVNGSPSGSNTSYFEGSSGEVFDRVDITRIDDYNATVKLTKTDEIEALLTINYPYESDYINYMWAITNISGSTMNDLRFFQAGDTYSYGSDYGYGYWEGSTNTVGCQKEDGGEIVSVFLQSIETPYQHESATYGFTSGVESHVMANALTGQVITTSHDNVIALEWRKPTLNNGESWVIHTIEKYSDKDITDLIVTAPFNQTIHQGQTKTIVFNVKNNSLSEVTDIELNEIINLAGWTVNVINPVGTFNLSGGEDIDVAVEVFCPVNEVVGTIARATLEAIANTETADDRAYIEVYSNLPGFDGQPVDKQVCSSNGAVSFGILSDNSDNYQWQINSGSWTNISDGGVFSGSTTDTLNISDVTGLIGLEFRCIIANTYGNASSNIVTIYPDDNAPGLNVTNLPAIIEQCSATVSIPTASDDCIGIVNGTTSSPLNYTEQGTYTITWTYEDNFGNISTQNQVVIIDDTQLPVRDNPILETIIGECSVTITDPPTASDNCAGTIIGTTTDPLTYDTQGTHIITWTYDDGGGNITTQTQQVLIEDQTAATPDLVSLPDIIESCEVQSITPPTATDNCDESITATTTATFPITESTTITWTFEDSNGNISTQTQNVIINDTIAPVLDQTILPTLTESCHLIVTDFPTATDNCSGQITGTTTDTLYYDLNGTYSITWSFEDFNGNIVTQTQNVIINDTIAPVPDEEVLPIITKSCSAIIREIPSATDLCSGQIFATTTDSIYYNTNGTRQITWTYEDDNGNTISQEQTVIVSNEKPVANTQNQTYRITVTTGNSETVTITPADIDNGSYDDCGIDSLYLDKTVFTADDEGENEVNLTVTDDSGNSDTKSAIVTIILDYLLEFPNLITPDGNGKNDYWVVNGIQDLEGYTLTIYNKLGEVVYESNNYDNTWDATYNGQVLPNGTYYYTFNLGKVLYSGFISVIR